MDPLTQKEYINKVVTVETTCGSLYKGVVYTVDPISGSFVLCDKDRGKDLPSCVEIIMGNRIRSVTVNDELPITVSLDKAFGESRWIGHKDTGLPLEATVEARKRKLVSWLAKHRIPVTENGSSLSILDALAIHPPYQMEDCISTNPIVLGRVQDLVKNMPHDFET